MEVPSEVICSSRCCCWAVSSHSKVNLVCQWLVHWRWLGIANTTSGLIFVHVVYGVGVHDTVFFFFLRNFLPVNSEMNWSKRHALDGAGFFTIFYRIYFASIDPYYCGHCDLASSLKFGMDFLFGCWRSLLWYSASNRGIKQWLNTSFGG